MTRKHNKRAKQYQQKANDEIKLTKNSTKSDRDSQKQKAESDPDEAHSIMLYSLLYEAGFNERDAGQQRRAADGLQSAAQQLAGDARQLVGSSADCWSRLVDSSSKPVAKAYFSWLIILNSKPEERLHLKGDCQCQGMRNQRLIVQAGRVLTSEYAGHLPILKVPECGLRPAQTIQHVIQCCSPHRSDKSRQLLPEKSDPDVGAILEFGMDTKQPNQLLLSYRLQEKRMMCGLSTVQGQLFVLIKFVFQRLLKTRVLKTYHARNLLFHMLSKYRNDGPGVWAKQSLIALLKEALDMMLKFLDKIDATSDACMPNFFLPEAPLRLVGTGVCCTEVKADLRNTFLDLKADLTPLLELVKSCVRPRKSGKVFQPFTVLPLVELADFDRCTGDALLYLTVQAMIKQVPELQPDDLPKFVERISKLRWLAGSSSIGACLLTMAQLKLGHLDSAKLKLEAVSWRQAEPCQFCFTCSERELDFSFLPEFTRSLMKLEQFGSGWTLQVNFRALLWSLQAELLPRRHLFLNEWRRGIEDDMDMTELHTMAHYSRSPKRLRNLSMKMNDLLSAKPGPEDSGRTSAINSKACFNGLSLVLFLSAALAILSRLGLILEGAAMLEGIMDIVIFCLGVVTYIELHRQLKFSAWLLTKASSSDWRRQWYTSVEFSVILPILSVALSFVANERFFYTIFVIFSQRMLPDLMRLQTRFERGLVELVLALR